MFYSNNSSALSEIRGLLLTFYFNPTHQLALDSPTNLFQVYISHFHSKNEKL